MSCSVVRKHGRRGMWWENDAMWLELVSISTWKLRGKPSRRAEKCRTYCVRVSEMVVLDNSVCFFNAE